jgi:hypothetical protein
MNGRHERLKLKASSKEAMIEAAVIAKENGVFFPFSCGDLTG